MNYVRIRSVTAGDLINETISVLSASRREIGLYLLVFGVLGLLLAVPMLEGLVSTASFFFYFVAQYWLCRQMLMRTGLTHHERFRVFSFFWMAMILGFVILVGFNFLWIPGILLGAKWVMAPTYLVGREGNMFEAIGAAWRASDGNLLPLSLAYTAVGVMGIIALWAVVLSASLTGTLFWGNGDLLDGPLEGAALSLSINALPILMMALSVGSYRLLSDETDNLADVFE